MKEGGKVWVLDRSSYVTAMMKTAQEATEDNIRMLKRIPPLKDLPQHVLSKISSLMIIEFFPAHSYIVQEGDPGDKFYIINAGSVTITKNSIYDEEIVLTELNKGEYFGEKALYEDGDKRRQANVVAQPPGVECLVIDRK